MNILFLHAHPEPKSFTSSLKNLAVEHFSKRGDQVVVNDLYAMKFNPVGFDIDFKERANPEYFHYLKEQMNAFMTNSYNDDLQLEMDKVKNADLVICVFPLWWSSVPAILKGWFDRVLSLGFAYHPRDRKFLTAPFRGKKAVCIVTAGGSNQAYTKEGENGDIMEMLYHIHHGTFYYCGFDVLPPFITWRTHLAPPEDLNKYLEDFQKYLNDFDSLEKLY
jgi:NAD(P)H dehydrogenase (quinone)